MYSQADNHCTEIGADQAGRQLLERTKTLLRDCRFTLARDRIVVFVCGGRAKRQAGEPLTWRAAFLEWFSTLGDATRIEVFLAEKAYDTAINAQHGFLNVGDFEEVLADLSDCVLLFPESAGAHAEAGVFANSRRKLFEKILVANERGHHNSSSFLSRGPLHRFGARSRFSSAIILDPEKVDNPSFETIRRRIEENALKNSTAIDWTSASDLDLRGKLAVTLSLIRTAGVLCQGDISELLQARGLPIPAVELSRVLRILRMFRQVESTVRHVYRYADDSHFRATIVGTKGNLTSLTASYRSYYLRTFPNLLTSVPGGHTG